MAVTIISLTQTGQTAENSDGTTEVQWGATVNVNGQVYAVTFWVLAGTPIDQVEELLIEDIEADPDDWLGGIADGDSPGDDDGDDDGGDSAVASGDGSDYGDSV